MSKQRPSWEKVQDKDSRDYWSTRGYRDSLRLNVQYWLSQRRNPYFVPPDVDLSTPGLKVADLGCGTAAFLLELEDQTELSPTAKLVGFDINPKLFPPPEFLPKRVVLHKFDILDPDSVPPEYVGAFDVVNARLLVTVFKGGDPSPFLRIASKMLKPRGWLRWTDCKSLSSEFNAVTLDPNRKREASDKVMARLKAFYTHLEMKPERFQDWESTYGLRIVSDTKQQSSPAFCKAATDPTLQLLEELRDRLPEVAEESEQGGYVLPTSCNDDLAEAFRMIPGPLLVACLGANLRVCWRRRYRNVIMEWQWS